MKLFYPLLIAAAVASCNQAQHEIHLIYTNHDISKQLDSMNSKTPVTVHGIALSAGIIEQASANCTDSATGSKNCIQDVLSSMYIATAHKLYNCITTTVFHLLGGDITAVGMFKLPLCDIIPPNHDFLIVGGSGVYANIYGTYRRHYINTIYHIELNYYTR